MARVVFCLSFYALMIIWAGMGWGKWRSYGTKFVLAWEQVSSSICGLTCFIWVSALVISSSTWHQEALKMHHLSYLLWPNNFPKLWQLRTRNIYYLTVSEEFGSGLGQWFRLRISHEITVKMSVRAVVIQRLDWNESIRCPGGSFVWLLVGGFSSLTGGPLLRADWASSQHGSCLPLEQVSQERCEAEANNAFYVLATESTHCRFHSIL